MTYNYPGYYPYNTSSSTTHSSLLDEFYYAFRKHREILDKKKRDADEFINEWVKETIGLIHKHALKQRQIVEEAYTKEKTRLSELETEYRNSKTVFRLNNKSDEIDALLNECKKLQVELIDTDYKHDNMRFIEMKPPGSATTNSAKSNQNDQNSTADSNKLTLIDRTDRPESNIDGTATEPKPRRSSISNRPGSASQSANSVRNDPKSSDSPDSIERTCQICFMLFPPTASSFDIRSHTNAHFESTV